MTLIPYAEENLEATAGCSRVSMGCDNCHGVRLAATRLCQNAKWAGLVDKATGHWTGEVRLLEEHLTGPGSPLRTRKPTTWFVNSRSDLFHEHVPTWYILRVLAVIAMRPNHRFIVLTKRAARMRAVMATLHPSMLDPSKLLIREGGGGYDIGDWVDPDIGWTEPSWPLRNLILGVSVEDQETADLRIRELVQTPAACRAVSAEPLLGGIVMRPEWLVGRHIDHLPAIRGADHRRRIREARQADASRLGSGIAESGRGGGRAGVLQTVGGVAANVPVLRDLAHRDW
jgi:protein gp37